jgi:mRNA interferase RelE/StbE
VNEFDLVLTAEAQDDIRRLSRQVQKRLLDKLEWLGVNASLLVHQPLKGEQWAGAFRYRVGDYRIIYLIDYDRKRLTVLKLGHRREIYKP